MMGRNTNGDCQLNHCISCFLSILDYSCCSYFSSIGNITLVKNNTASTSSSGPDMGFDHSRMYPTKELT